MCNNTVVAKSTLYFVLNCNNFYNFVTICERVSDRYLGDMLLRLYYTIQLTQLTSDAVLGLVVTCRNIRHYPSLSLSPGPTVLLVKIRIGFILLLLPEEVIFLVCVQIPANIKSSFSSTKCKV